MKFNASQTVRDLYASCRFLWIKFSPKDSPSAKDTMMLTPCCMISLAISHSYSGSIARPRDSHYLVLIILALLHIRRLSITAFPIIILIILLIVITCSLNLVYSLLCCFISFLEVKVCLKLLPKLNFPSLFLPKHFIAIKDFLCYILFQ